MRKAALAVAVLALAIALVPIADAKKKPPGSGNGNSGRGAQSASTGATCPWSDLTERPSRTSASASASPRTAEHSRPGW